MSYTLTDAAFNQFNVNGAQQRILTGLCTFASNMGHCFPSVAAIAEKCKISIRTVERHLPELERKGIIERQNRLGRSSITRIHLVTPAKMAVQTRQNVGTESVIESEYQITAQPAAPVVAESPASAAIVVLKAMDTEALDTAPLADLPVIDMELVAHEPVVDVPAAVITVDLVADTATAMPEIVTVPAIAPVVELLPALPAAHVPDAVAQVQALPNAPVDPLADVPASLLEDFGEVRRAKKKAPKVTLLESQMLAREAAKARLTIEDVIKLCILRGWARFEAVFATPYVMAQFRASMMPDQAPVSAPQRFYQPEAAPPASSGAISAAKAAMAAALERMKAEPVDPLDGPRRIIAKYERGEHVSGFALRAAKYALRL